MTTKEVVNKYLGIKFEHGGRSMQCLDCFGLMQKIAADLGIKIPDYHYEESESAGIWAEDFHKYFNKILKSTLRLWDLLVFSPVGCDMIHIGTVVDDIYFIHCTKENGVQLSRIDDPRYSRRIKGYFRFKEQLDGRV